MKIELIAECASNAGGDMALAKEFIKRFADAGADWIKWQATRVKHLNPADSQFEWFKKVEWSTDQLAELKASTEAAGAKFLVTVFNAADLPEIESLGCEAVKLGAGEQFDSGLLVEAWKTPLRVIRSLDFGGDPDWWRRVKDNSPRNDNILSTVTRYPASQRACLRAIERIGYYHIQGYSDHSIGTEMATWAMECGARIIEKHVQLDHQARSPKAFEATVSEFKYLRTFADDDPDLKFRGRWQYA